MNKLAQSQTFAELPINRSELIESTTRELALLPRIDNSSGLPYCRMTIDNPKLRIIYIPGYGEHLKKHILWRLRAAQMHLERSGLPAEIVVVSSPTHKHGQNTAENCGIDSLIQAWAKIINQFEPTCRVLVAGYSQGASLAAELVVSGALRTAASELILLDPAVFDETSSSKLALKFLRPSMLMQWRRFGAQYPTYGAVRDAWSDNEIQRGYHSYYNAVLRPYFSGEYRPIRDWLTSSKLDLMKRAASAVERSHLLYGDDSNYAPSEEHLSLLKNIEGFNYYQVTGGATHSWAAHPAAIAHVLEAILIGGQ